MKQYFDITHAVKADSVYELMFNSQWLLPEEIVSLEQSIIGSTYVYLPGTTEHKTTLDTVFAGRFFSKAWIISLRNIAPGEVLTCDVLGSVDDELLPGDSIIINTQWNKYLDDNELYKYKYPIIGADLAEWFARNQVNTLLVDTPFLNHTNYMPEFTETYKILGQGNVMIVCGVNNLNVLSMPHVQLVLMPLKIKNTNISLVRAIAINQ